MNKHARILLAFDYGLKRIGVAIGQELTHSASPLTTLYSKNAKPDWNAIEQLIQAWRPNALVVGVPFHMDGTEHEITQAARKFGRQLQGRYQLPVFEMDERLSSVEAEAQLRAQAQSTGNKFRIDDPIDPIAAQIILQSWFEQQEQAHEAEQ